MAPTDQNFLHAVFGKFCMLAPSPGGFAPSPTWNPGSAPEYSGRLKYPMVIIFFDRSMRKSHITSNDRPFIYTDTNSQCYFPHRRLKNPRYNNAYSLTGTSCLTIIARNETICPTKPHLVVCSQYSC